MIPRSDRPVDGCLLRVQRMGYEAAGGRLIGRRIFVVVVAACGTETGSEVKHACAAVYACTLLGKAKGKRVKRLLACRARIRAEPSQLGSTH